MIVVLHSARLSGAEICTLRYSPSLAAFDATFVSLQPGPIVDALREQGYEVEVVRYGGAFRNVGRNGRAWRTVRQFSGLLKGLLALRTRLSRSTEPVLASSLKAGVIVALATLGMRKRHRIVWVHDHVSSEYFGLITAGVLRLFLRVIPTGIVVNSESTRQSLGRTLKPSFVAYPPVREDLLSLANDRDYSGLGSLVVTMVGRLSPWKGQEILLRAAAADRSGCIREVNIVGGALFGEDTYAQSLQTLARELDIEHLVRFTPHTDDVAPWLQEADIFVHASTLPEPFGMVIIEALAAGCAVIAADAGGPKEILRNMQDGLLVKPGSVEELRAAIHGLAVEGSLRRQIGSAGRERAEDFRADPLGDKLHAWLVTVLAREL